jgi:histidine triad (HIT) family protein
MNCTFSAIVDGSAPSWVVHEDGVALAFLDIGAATPGHTLVVPKMHTNDIWSIAEEDAAAVMRTVHQVAAQLRDALQPLGLNITQANGEAAGQEVFHYHVHLVPRHENDGLRPPWRATRPSHEELAEIQRRLTPAVELHSMATRREYRPRPGELGHPSRSALTSLTLNAGAVNAPTVHLPSARAQAIVMIQNQA